MAQTSVTTGAAVLVAKGADISGQWVTLRAITGAVFLGPSNAVTTANGMIVNTADPPLTVPLESDEEIWAIAATVTAVVQVLQTG